LRLSRRGAERARQPRRRPASRQPDAHHLRAAARAPARAARPGFAAPRSGSRLMSGLRPDWCPPLPSMPGSFDAESGHLFCPWCDEGHWIDEDADPDDLDACPGCGRAIEVFGPADDEDEGIVRAV